MTKPWEYMSRDEKLDYMRARLDSIDASLSKLVKRQEVDLLSESGPNASQEQKKA